MKRICAWCRKDMGKSKDDEEGETHGICPECKKKLYKELDSLDNPEKKSEPPVER